MITHLSIQNFKSLRKLNLDLKPLNLLVGLNGMGKSSLVQALLILRQSRDLNVGMVSLNDYMVQLGEGRDAMYQYSKEDFIRIAFTGDDNQELSWTMKYEPAAQELIADNPYSFSSLQEFSLFSANFQYLRAERSAPLDEYRMSSLEVGRDRQIGIDGEYAIHYLNQFGTDEVPDTLRHPAAKSPFLLAQVDAWMGEISPGIKLNTSKIQGLNKILLDIQYEGVSGFTNRFRPKNVGFGITYVLPVVVALLSTSPGRLIIIENPESHVHPRGQAEMGKLIALSAAAGAQLIVETHSDHVLNGIRVAVKDAFIPSQDVGLYYFEKRNTPEEQFTRVTTISIDKNGTLSAYPEHLLDEWSNQLSKLV
jgi:predicted ATPase